MSNDTFQVGDVVRCVDPGFLLKDGFMYEVAEAYETGGEPFVRLLEPNTSYYASRFVLVQREHPSTQYTNMGTQLGALVEEKNQAYGSAFDRAGNILRELYPNGIRPEQYDDMLAIVRIQDKCFRIATRKDAFGESPYKDIAGYGILGAVKDEARKSGGKEHVAKVDTGNMSSTYSHWSFDADGRATESD